VFTIAAFGTGILVYLAAWIIFPRRGYEPNADAQEDLSAEMRGDTAWYTLIPGAALVMLGLLLMARHHWHWFGLGHLWPIAIVALGVAFIVRGWSRRPSTSHRVNGFDVHHQNGGSVS
jgi:hypothetical protein